MTVHHIVLYLSCLQYIIVMLFRLQPYIALTVIYVILPKMTSTYPTVSVMNTTHNSHNCHAFSALYCSYINICNFTQGDSHHILLSVMNTTHNCHAFSALYCSYSNICNFIQDDVHLSYCICHAYNTQCSCFFSVILLLHTLSFNVSSRIYILF